MGNKVQIYRDIAERTGGDIYIGVVGPVRSGKSTFIKRFMENVVLPKMEEGAKKERATDEIPQSAGGKIVMTTEPKFVPEESVRIELEQGVNFRVKLIDCVGFPVEGAEGMADENGPRLVNTPWSSDPVPFDEAASLGTKKVIRDHSTVGILITTDGSIGEIDRDSYIDAEEKAVHELKETGKPFVVLLNSKHPDHPDTLALSRSMSQRWNVSVIPENCFQLKAEDITSILEKIVLEFPVRSAFVSIPGWIMGLESDHPIREEVFKPFRDILSQVRKTGAILEGIKTIDQNKTIRNVKIDRCDLGTGNLSFCAEISDDSYSSVLSETSGLPIQNEEDLLHELKALSAIRTRFDKIEAALKDSEESGYGIVLPAIEDMELEEPEIVRQPGGYGVKFKASAPSLHLIRTKVKAEIFPIVGSERQSEDIVKYLLKEYETKPNEIWNSNMFGKKLYELVNEGISAKLEHLQDQTRSKFIETLEKIINDGSGGMICIIL